jgi:hypothetical protein
MPSCDKKHLLMTRSWRLVGDFMSGATIAAGGQLVTVPPTTYDTEIIVYMVGVLTH